VLFVPWVPAFWEHFGSRVTGYWIRPLTWDAPVKFISLLTGTYLTDERGRWLVTAITWVLLTGGLGVLWRNPATRERVGLLAAWLFVPIGLLTVLSLRQNLFLPRVILFVAPAFALVMGLAVTQLVENRQRIWAGLMAGVLIALNLHALHGYYTRENWWIKAPFRELAAAIAGKIEPTDVVLHTSEFTYRPLQIYLGDTVRQGVVPVFDSEPGVLKIIGDGKLTKAQRIWLVAFPNFRHPNLHHCVTNWMNQHHHLRQELIVTNRLYVAIYESTDARLPESSDCVY
jgi:4-amino-4-deoxy-L-arabinose transferase-like glycosyltransferase